MHSSAISKQQLLKGALRVDPWSVLLVSLDLKVFPKLHFLPSDIASTGSTEEKYLHRLTSQILAFTNPTITAKLALSSLLIGCLIFRSTFGLNCFAYILSQSLRRKRLPSKNAGISSIYLTLEDADQKDSFYQPD